MKDLPCSIVRAFARQLSIKIPWTKLATDPIEVVLDTVECVLAEGKEPPANPKNLSKGKPAATRPTSQSPGFGLNWLLLLSIQNFGKDSPLDLYVLTLLLLLCPVECS